MTIRLLVGHVLDRLAEIPDESIQCCVTSPPYYGLRDYGIEPQVWGGDPSCAHEWQEESTPPRHRDNGVTGSTLQGGKSTQEQSQRTPSTHAFCRHCNAWRGSLGLEPTLALYLDHLVTVCREIRRVLRKDGTFFLNVGDSYAGSPSSGFRPGSGRADGIVDERGQRNRNGTPAPPGLKPKDLMLVPHRLAIRPQNDGWFVRSEIVWAKDAPMPESVSDRPTSAHEKIFLLTKSPRYFYDAEAVKEDAETSTEHRDRYPRNGNKAGLAREYQGAPDGLINCQGRRNLRNVWKLPPAPFPDAHFATFPPELPRRCIMAGSRPGNTILDPFAGSGTTLLVADQLQRHAVGIELNPQYAAMAQHRIQQDAPLFTDVQCRLHASHNATNDPVLLPLYTHSSAIP